jgi:ficolin
VNLNFNILFSALSECQIHKMTYLIDTSGSMHKSGPIWKPVALDLIDVMEARQVNIMDYTLLDYVTTVHVTTTTSSNVVFYDAVDNLTISGGSKEHTFSGLLTALEMSNCHNFICVFTDEIGNDAYNLVLKQEILIRKSLTKSEIFFMVMSSSETRSTTFQGIFADIGHVIDITNTIDAVKDVVDLMKASIICTENCTVAPTEVKRPRTMPDESSPWITILRRGQYGNPVALFSDSAFFEYVAGFGDQNEEFWFGLKKLARMTNNSIWELQVELVDFEENTYVAEYSSFKVEGAEKKYSLTVNGFNNESNLQDSLSYHNGMGFSAKDKDNDDFKGNCSQPHGGWWHNSCFQSNLFGNNFNTENANMNGIVWRNDENVPNQGLGFSWPFAEMKIKQSG